VVLRPRSDRVEPEWSGRRSGLRSLAPGSRCKAAAGSNRPPATMTLIDGIVGGRTSQRPTHTRPRTIGAVNDRCRRGCTVRRSLVALSATGTTTGKSQVRVSHGPRSLGVRSVMSP
jgi:hypothetical protein